MVIKSIIKRVSGASFKRFLTGVEDVPNYLRLVIVRTTSNGLKVVLSVCPSVMLTFT